MKNWIGRRFGMLVVSGVIKPHKYECNCDCGRTIGLWDKFLYQGKIDCGCVKFKDDDLTGKKFGRWTVLSPLNPNRIEKWKCRCDCGKERVVGGCSLKNGDSVSCGCVQREKASELGGKTVSLLEGKRFGRLVVMLRNGSSGDGKALWLCRCDCGKEKVVSSRALVSGRTKSCGCYHKEVWQKLIRNPDLTDEERELQRQRRCDPKTVEWKIKVHQKCGQECVVCGEKRGGKLVAHHKESWNSNKDLRYDVGNGATACKKCHVEFHSLYGAGDNTESQWKEFLELKKGCVRASPVRVIRRRKRVDLSGMRFGKLRIVKKEGGEYSWLCECDCGVVKRVGERNLVRGQTKSCGCLQKGITAEVGRKNVRYVPGMRFGRLVIVERLLGQRLLCGCDCGGERIVSTKFLRNGQAVDCQSSKNENKCSLRRVV